MPNSSIRNASQKIGWFRLLGFSSLWYPLGAVTLPLTVFLPPLYAGRSGLGLILVGQIVMVTRLIDLIADPFIGAASDTTQARFGRRKIWIVCGLPIFCFGCYLLFNPPVFHVGQTNSMFSSGGTYLAIASLLTALGSSLILVPHTAWSSELSDDYDQRSRIMGTNEWINLIGILGVAVIGALMEQLLHADIFMQMQFMALMLIVTAPICVAVCTLTMPEPKRCDRVRGEGMNLISALRNGLFFRLSAVKFVNSVAESIAQSLWIFVCASVLGLASSATTLLAIHIVMGFVSIPLWTWLSYRWGKRFACMSALAWRVFLTPFILLLPIGNFAAVATFMATLGLSLGVESSLLRAMVADVVDHQQAITGHRQAGLFQGTFNVISNVGKSLGIGLAYPLLAVLGYGGKIQIGAHGAILPALFYAFVPPALNFVGIVWLGGYRLSKRDVVALQETKHPHDVPVHDSYHPQ